MIPVLFAYILLFVYCFEVLARFILVCVVSDATFRAPSRCYVSISILWDLGLT